MSNPRIRDVKHAQREAVFLREVSNLMLQLSMDDPALSSLIISRVKLSPDRGICTIYFTCPEGKEGFQEKLGKLILYKPSMRSSLAKSIAARYTPDLIFRYDDQSIKQQRIEELLSKVAANKTRFED